MAKENNDIEKQLETYKKALEEVKAQMKKHEDFQKEITKLKDEVKTYAEKTKDFDSFKEKQNKIIERSDKMMDKLLETKAPKPTPTEEYDPTTGEWIKNG